LVKGLSEAKGNKSAQLRGKKKRVKICARKKRKKKIFFLKKGKYAAGQVSTRKKKKGGTGQLFWQEGEGEEGGTIGGKAGLLGGNQIGNDKGEGGKKKGKPCVGNKYNWWETGKSNTGAEIPKGRCDKTLKPRIKSVLLGKQNSDCPQIWERQESWGTIFQLTKKGLGISTPVHGLRGERTLDSQTNPIVEAERKKEKLKNKRKGRRTGKAGPRVRKNRPSKRVG